ncbi:DUF5309 family protein [uncultured Microbacterium sp.]|uniref:SU10 major capsid protein n=1 Tax=uncultured Microbacterium sp. TaxID=191216 RepID=UPI0025E7A33E|nr:DUF5309 family protein [uncultured Microbacterium sp.]
MAGISGLGTTYNLPNYVGELFAISPANTPLLSAIGGLTGGKQASAPAFTWQTYDLRNPSQPAVLEGALAPTGQNRVRGVVGNVCQIHQEKVTVSYTKQAAVGAINSQNVDTTRGNPVQNELDWQVAQALKTIGRDVEWSFINGVYQAPSDNSTARRTRGLLAAIQTNAMTIAAQNTGTGLSAATTVITEASTPVANGDKVIFTDVGASTTIVTGRTYYVVAKGSGVFSVAASLGGPAITIGTATVSYSRPAVAATTVATYENLFQQVYDQGGLEDSDLATIIVNSTQKRNLAAAYAASYGKFIEQDRNLFGVNVTRIESNLGSFNIMLDRYMPQDALIVTSLDQLNPVFLETPGKGHFFEEPLAKTGASDDVQIYGEIGLEYGNELAHGSYRGLPL